MGPPPQPAHPPRRFRWPPKPLQPAAPAPPAGPRARQGAADPQRPRWAAALLEVERTWLNLETPPLADRIAAEAWAPDHPDVYCARCGRTVGPHEATAEGCSACRRRRLPWERLIRLGEYRALLRDVVRDVKFTRWRRLGDDVGRILGVELRMHLVRAGADPALAAITPVPTSWWHRLRRGIDHPLVIARGAAAASSIPIAQLLTRSHRPSQTAVPAAQRRANVGGSIRPRRALQSPAPHIIVLDDVTTTRATLLAACSAVRRVPGVTRVWAAVLAVTPEPRARPVLPPAAPDGAETPEFAGVSGGLAAEAGGAG